jgi:hypothetical protein
MATTPTHKIGDVVYLKESAALGFLETVLIKRISSTVDGTWNYGIDVAVRPSQGGTYGDMIGGTTMRQVVYSEAELITKCEALQLCLNYATRLKDAIAAKFEAACDEAS